MHTGKGIGTATATVKHPTLTGAKLLLVQLTLADEITPDGDPLLVVDGIGAGCGDTVLISSDTRRARELLAANATPVRWTTVGIKD